MTSLGDEQTFGVTTDGMCIDYQVPVTMSDGAVLRADVFRPCDDGRYPVILSHGVYAKGLPFNGPIYWMQWDKLVVKDPSVLEGSTGKYQAWEVTDPERWIPHGYVVVRADSRGRGGRKDCSAREALSSTTTLPSRWSGQRPSRGAMARSGSWVSPITR